MSSSEPQSNAIKRDYGLRSWKKNLAISVENSKSHRLNPITNVDTVVEVATPVVLPIDQKVEVQENKVSENPKYIPENILVPTENNVNEKIIPFTPEVSSKYKISSTGLAVKSNTELAKSATEISRMTVTSVGAVISRYQI